MEIKNIEGCDINVVQNALNVAILLSRFTGHFRQRTSGRRTYLHCGGGFGQSEGIRLEEKKHYCGNHPNGCEGTPHRHAKRNYLEGADWVEFNDLVNDVLDRLEVSAKAGSSICIIRKGRRRRTVYGSFYPGGQAWQWNRDEPDHCYEDRCGRIGPASDFPEGTPGIHVKAQPLFPEDSHYACVGHADHQH